MITIQDCIELSELTEEEVLAIAQHEGIPEMAAVELGNYLARTAEGEQRIKAMILDDILEAQRGGHLQRVLTLKICLRHYVQQHGGARPT